MSTFTVDAPARTLIPVRRSWLSDVRLVMTRELRPVVREPFSVVFGLIQPLVFLGLFGPLLAGSVGAAGGFSGAEVWQWFVPAILVMTTLFGTSTTGSNLQFEMQTGAHERLLVTPLSRSSQLVGRSLKEIVPLVAQAVVVILVMLPFGFRADPVGAPIGLAMLAVLGVGLGSLSYALAIAVRKQEWMFWVVQQTVLFPLLILSGMLLPLETGPQWMKVASAFDPLRWVVEAERALFAGDLTSSAVTAGWAAAVLTAVVGLAVGVRTLLRSTD
jgi:ABC-2 type transport system permease protein